MLADCLHLPNYSSGFTTLSTHGVKRGFWVGVTRLRKSRWYKWKMQIALLFFSPTCPFCAVHGSAGKPLLSSFDTFSRDRYVHTLLRSVSPFSLPSFKSSLVPLTSVFVRGRVNTTIGPDFCCRKGTTKESGPEPSLALVTSKSPVSLTPERAAFREGSTPSRRNIGAGVGGGHVRRCRPRTRKRPSSWRQLPSRAKHQTRRELIRSRRPPPQAGNTTSVSQVRKLRFSEVEHLPRRCPAHEGGARSPDCSAAPTQSSRERGPATPTPRGSREQRGQQSWTEGCAQEQWGAATGGGRRALLDGGPASGRSGSMALLPLDFEAGLGVCGSWRGNTWSFSPPAPGQGGSK